MVSHSRRTGPGTYHFDRFTTGSLGLDLIMDGGWKRGAINELWGGPGSGKTVVVKQTLQHRHIVDKNALWVDTGAHTMLAKDPSLLYINPRTAEQAFVALDMATDYEYGLAFAIVDDANHLVRQAELDDDPDYTPHPQREYAAELTKLRAELRETNVGVIFLSQPRENQRPPIRGTGISEKADERISLRIVEHKQNDEILVQATRKATGKSTQFWVVPGKGIDRNRELLQYGLRYGYIEQDGSWFTIRMGGTRLRIQGAATVTEYLENTAAGPRLESKLRERVGTQIKD